MPARVFRINAENPTPVLWTDAFGEEAFGRLRMSNLGIPWVALRRRFEDETPATLGLAVRILYDMCSGSSIEVDKLVDGKWVEVKERDWGVFNAKRA